MKTIPVQYIEPEQCRFGNEMRVVDSADNPGIHSPIPVHEYVHLLKKYNDRDGDPEPRELI